MSGEMTSAALRSETPVVGRKPVVGPFTVSIEDIAEAATYKRLEDAVQALWGALRALPLGWEQYAAYRDFFDDDAVERVTVFLERRPQLTLTFSMAGRTHVVQIEDTAPSR